MAVKDERLEGLVKIPESEMGVSGTSELSEKEKKDLEECGFGPLTEEEAKKNYKVWEVSYNYAVPSDSPNQRSTDTYLIPAESISKAEEKANSLLSDYAKWLLDNGKVRQSIKEYTVKVPFPNLTSDDDKNNFFLEARLSSDGVLANTVIEYVARPYLVKKGE